MIMPCAHRVAETARRLTCDEFWHATPYTLLEARFKHHISGGGHLAVIANPDSPAIPELQIVALKASFDFHANLADALHACASADTSTGH
jgi:hypothetical protein